VEHIWRRHHVLSRPVARWEEAPYERDAWQHKPPQEGQEKDDSEGYGELAHLILTKYFLCDGFLGPQALDVHATASREVLQVRERYGRPVRIDKAARLGVTDLDAT